MDIKGIKILYAWFLLIKIPSVIGLDVNPVNPKKFDTVVITANASGLSTVIWEKDAITLTSCFVTLDRCSSPNKISGATIAVDSGMAESTITIPSANQTFHGGLYKATGSNSVDVIINTLPATINWTVQPQGNLTAGSSATWTAKVYCVFPTPEINVDFSVYIEGVKEVSPRSPTLTKETDPNCDFPEETVVAMLSLSSSDIQTFLNKKVYIIANASHGSFPTEPSVISGQSAEAIFQGVYTSTPTSITKPPPEKTCVLQIPVIGEIACWIIFALLIIVVLTVVVLVYFKFCKKQQSDKDKYPETTNDGATQADSTVKITHVDSAIRRGDNRSVSKPNNKESKDSATGERAKESRKSTIDMPQHENVSNDDTNIGGKNEKKEESTNGKDDNVSLDTSNYGKSKYSANGKRVINSKSMDTCSLKQNESLSNNAKNIDEKDDKNVRKSEDVELEVRT